MPFAAGVCEPAFFSQCTWPVGIFRRLQPILRPPPARHRRGLRPRAGQGARNPRRVRRRRGREESAAGAPPERRADRAPDEAPAEDRGPHDRGRRGRRPDGARRRRRGEFGRRPAHGRGDDHGAQARGRLPVRARPGARPRVAAPRHAQAPHQLSAISAEIGLDRDGVASMASPWSRAFVRNVFAIASGPRRSRDGAAPRRPRPHVQRLARVRKVRGRLGLLLLERGAAREAHRERAQVHGRQGEAGPPRGVLSVAAVASPAER